MLLLSQLKAPRGVKKNRKRVGRGIGSGVGKTCGKGQKGQKSRSGAGIHPWFEGGQMALQRRLPKRGFHNLFRKTFAIVNVAQLAKLATDDPITPELLKERGVIRAGDSLKILGDGEIDQSMTVHAHKFSKSALEKIEKAGGKAVVL